MRRKNKVVLTIFTYIYHSLAYIILTIKIAYRSSLQYAVHAFAVACKIRPFDISDRKHFSMTVDSY